MAKNKQALYIALIILLAVLIAAGAYYVSVKKGTSLLQLPSASSVPSSTSVPMYEFPASEEQVYNPTQTPKPVITPKPSPVATVVSGNSSNPYSWPIESVCTPVQRPEDPVVIKDLGDGTYVYKRTDGTSFRGERNHCKCLSGQTLISTPEGMRMVKDLRMGMNVFTLDTNGNKVIVPLLKVAKVSVPDNYRISRVVLSDGRELFASNPHPTADGRTIGDLVANDSIDGAYVASREVVVYVDSFTYDILPSGDTGFYWANSILLGSTLSLHAK